MNKINYQKWLDKTIEEQEKEGKVPTLLLHSCCAPCSSYCIEYLSQFFRITVFYYNPNITEETEYRKRVEEQKRFIQQFQTKYPVSFIEGDYAPKRFFRHCKGIRDSSCREENGVSAAYEMRL